MLKIKPAFGALLPSKAARELNATRPSGDHDGGDKETKFWDCRVTVSLVKGCGLEPSAFITQVFSVPLEAPLPSRALLDIKAILLLSGDQAGLWPATEGLVNFVRGTGLEPSALMVQMFRVGPGLRASLPSRARMDSNAILAPSGDQRGAETLTFVSLVNGCRPEPSALITQMLSAGLAMPLPERARSEAKMILPPSGDQAGDRMVPPDWTLSVVRG